MVASVTYIVPAQGVGLVQEWAFSMRRRNLSPGTIEKRMSVISRLQAHAHCALVDITTEQIESWLDSRSNSARTRYTDISHIHAFFDWAIRQGFVDVDPTARIDRPKVRPGLPRPIDTDDLRRVLRQALDPKLSAMLHLAAFAGLRCSEIAALRGEDISGDMMLVNGKGGKQRVVPVHPLIHAALKAAHMPVYGSIFHLLPWQVSHVIRDHLQACGVRASAHQLRHWFATNVYEASGNDLRMTQELLGHSSPSTTAIYTQWAKGRSLDVVTSMTA